MNTFSMILIGIVLGLFIAASVLILNRSATGVHVQQHQPKMGSQQFQSIIDNGGHPRTMYDLDIPTYEGVPRYSGVGEVLFKLVFLAMFPIAITYSILNL